MSLHFIALSGFGSFLFLIPTCTSSPFIFTFVQPLFYLRPLRYLLTFFLVISESLLSSFPAVCWFTQLLFCMLKLSGLSPNTYISWTQTSGAPGSLPSLTALSCEQCWEETRFWIIFSSMLCHLKTISICWLTYNFWEETLCHVCLHNMRPMRMLH